MRSTHIAFVCILLRCLAISVVFGRALSLKGDICDRQPTINGLCVSSTLGIYYDAETQHCKYMGCSPDKKLFATLEDCEKICNNNRHRRRRVNNNYNKRD